LCNGVSLLLELQNALPELMALTGQGGRVNQHAIALDAVQCFAAGHLQLVDAAQAVIGLQARPQHPVHIQRHVRVFAGISGGAGHIHLAERNLVRAFATQVFVAQTLATHMALGQAGQAMRLVHFQHIALQHGVVGIALHLNAMVGKHMAVVFDVLTQFERGWVFQPGLQLRQHGLARQLIGRVRADVGQGNVSSLPRLDGKTDADNFGAHLVE